MPLIGGGGAGNTAGSPSDIGGNLQYAGGNTWAGLSGWLAVSDGADATLFSFTSPLRIALEVDLYYSFDYSLINNEKFWGMELQINGQTVVNPKTDATANFKMHGMPLENRVKFIAFPGDKVVILGQTDDDGGTFCGGTLIAKGLYE